MPYPKKHSQQDIVIINSNINTFAYAITKRGSIERIIKKLQSARVFGKIVQRDIDAGAVLVQFRNTSKPLWMKNHEVEFIK